MADSDNSTRQEAWQHAFLSSHKLDNVFLSTTTPWLDPLATAIAESAGAQERPLVIGVNGAQGSGKSTASDYLCQALSNRHQLNTVALSLDDFYLTREERRLLATRVHPLLQTRGVPGTHDHELLDSTLQSLVTPGLQHAVAIPRFNKATDDRHPMDQWDTVTLPMDVIVLEGWCLGATAQADADLTTAINALEATEDPDGTWRRHSNAALRSHFHPLYASIDQWVMLAAPAFDNVFAWRKEQEHKLASHTDSTQPNRIMDEQSLLRFISHFERVTRHCLQTLPPSVNHLYRLDAARKIIAYHHQPGARLLAPH